MIRVVVYCNYKTIRVISNRVNSTMTAGYLQLPIVPVWHMVVVLHIIIANEKAFGALFRNLKNFEPFPVIRKVRIGTGV